MCRDLCQYWCIVRSQGRGYRLTDYFLERRVTNVQSASPPPLSGNHRHYSLDWDGVCPDIDGQFSGTECHITFVREHYFLLSMLPQRYAGNRN